ncbi:MAG: hypothetical protein WBC22_15375 [Sedimentisphaerales bacterium]
MAAPTVLKTASSVEANTISENFNWATVMTDYDSSPRLVSITFVPGANSDKLMVRDGSAAGPLIFHALCLNTDEKIQYYHGGRKWPFIVEGDCTLSSGHKVIFDLEVY